MTELVILIIPFVSFFAALGGYIYGCRSSAKFWRESNRVLAAGQDAHVAELKEQEDAREALWRSFTRENNKMIAAMHRADKRYADEQRKAQAAIRRAEFLQRRVTVLRSRLRVANLPTDEDS